MSLLSYFGEYSPIHVIREMGTSRRDDESSDDIKQLIKECKQFSEQDIENIINYLETPVSLHPFDFHKDIQYLNTKFAHCLKSLRFADSYLDIPKMSYIMSAESFSVDKNDIQYLPCIINNDLIQRKFTNKLLIKINPDNIYHIFKLKLKHILAFATKDDIDLEKSLNDAIENDDGDFCKFALKTCNIYMLYDSYFKNVSYQNVALTLIEKIIKLNSVKCLSSFFSVIHLDDTLFSVLYYLIESDRLNMLKMFIEAIDNEYFILSSNTFFDRLIEDYDVYSQQYNFMETLIKFDRFNFLEYFVSNGATIRYIWRRELFDIVRNDQVDFFKFVAENKPQVKYMRNEHKYDTSVRIEELDLHEYVYHYSYNVYNVKREKILEYMRTLNI